MTCAGRKVQVQFVLTSMVIYLDMAIDFPQSAISNGQDKKKIVMEVARMLRAVTALLLGAGVSAPGARRPWNFKPHEPWPEH